MGNLIRNANTSIPGLPSDVAGADVPGELRELLDLDDMLIPCQHILQNRNSMGVERGVTRLDAKTKDLLMQKMCQYVVACQHVALLEGQKRKSTQLA